uniref:Carboxylic ester hydrolase n=1 Tax=Ascaris suum TaxID=6253 RepID=F1KZX8_ASCSU
MLIHAMSLLELLLYVICIYQIRSSTPNALLKPMSRVMNRWLLLLSLPFLSSTQSPPIVPTQYGEVKGFYFGGIYDVTAIIFLGIPFAKPPVGDLRFERPEEPDAWSGTLDATHFKPGCPPHHRSAITTSISEDCLYLNIMAPFVDQELQLTHKSKFPVLVWIHGGGFNTGSADLYHYGNITKNFVASGIVVVTIQYRLGPLGFLSSGEKELPGNLGYWDKTAALRFIKKNIANFGGDPNRITIFGLSSGGASVGGLSISPHSRDLFEQSIEMSGPTLAEWAASESVVEASKALAKHLGCNVDNSTQMKHCMKTKSFDEILDAVEETGKSRYALNIIKYGPRIDGDFFPKDFEELIKEAPPKPTIVGTAEKEGLFFTILGESDCLHELYIRPQNFEQYGKSDLIDFIREIVAPKRLFAEHSDEVQRKLIEHYVNISSPYEEDYKFYLERYTLLITDALFHVPLVREAHMKTQLGWPVWLYVTDHYNPALFRRDLPVKGATHVGEFPYLFGIFPYGEFLFDEDETQMQFAMVEALRKFIKNGNPSSEVQEWAPTTPEHPGRHLRFRPRTVMEEVLFNETIAFWESMNKYDFDIIRGMTRTATANHEEL